MDALENWEKGEELHFAYWHWGDQRQKEQYSNSTDERRSRALKSLLYADLFARLNSGLLIAYGHCIAPTISDGPVAIPHHCFELRPDIENCDGDIVIASGWHYERVRIVERDAADVGAVEVSVLPPAKAKVGRRSGYAAARSALIEMHESDPALIEIPAERLHPTFLEFYGRHAKAKGMNSPIISPRTLQTHLARFRQELVETGKNDFAN